LRKASSKVDAEWRLRHSIDMVVMNHTTAESGQSEVSCLVFQCPLRSEVTAAAAGVAKKPGSAFDKVRNVAPLKTEI
jgi:hypothetical protein